MEDQDRLVTREMLASVADCPKVNADFSNVHFDRLTSDDVLKLMEFPTIVTKVLTSSIDKDRSALLMERGKKADEEGDVKTLVDVLNQINDQLQLVTSAIFAPIHIPYLFTDLLIAMTNYIILVKVLRHYIEDGTIIDVIEWSNNIEFDNIMPTSRFQYAINLMWQLNTLAFTIGRLNIPDYEWKTMPVVAHLLNEGEKNEEFYYCIGLHPLDENMKPEVYVLWIGLWDNGAIKFLFKPLWAIEDNQFVRNLCFLLMMLEIDTRHRLSVLLESWQQFIVKPDNTVINNTSAITDMMNLLASKENILNTSFDYASLSMTLGSLDWRIQGKPQIDKACRDYKKKFKKGHVSPDLIDALREAMPAIRSLWNKISENKHYFDKDAIHKYVKENPERYFFTTPDHIAKRGQKYHENIETSGERDLIEESLVTVSARKGHQLSRSLICHPRLIMDPPAQYLWTHPDVA